MQFTVLQVDDLELLPEFKKNLENFYHYHFQIQWGWTPKGIWFTLFAKRRRELNYRTLSTEDSVLSWPFSMDTFIKMSK